MHNDAYSKPAAIQDGFFKRYATYVVAEMACAHDGVVKRAIQIIDAASQSKADAIQFQIFTIRNLMSPLSPDFGRAQKLEIPAEAWSILFSHARSHGLDVWATVFDEASLSIARECAADVIKIHSSDLSNPELLDLAAQTGKPIALAIGGSLPEELERALGFLRGRGVRDILLMHGYQAFPTPTRDSHLRFIQTLANEYGYPVGYQDHTDGSSLLAMILPLAAIGFGAVVLEKHITDDRTRKGTDYESSLGPAEFSQFVELVRAIDEASGDGKKRLLTPAEIEYRKRMKKSAHINCDIGKGEIITREKLSYLRGGVGVSPWEANDLVGHTAARDLSPFTPLSAEDVVWRDWRK